MTWTQFLFDAASQGVGDLCAGVLLVWLAVWAEAKMDERRDQRRDRREQRRRHE